MLVTRPAPPRDGAGRSEGLSRDGGEASHEEMAVDNRRLRGPGCCLQGGADGGILMRLGLDGTSQ